MFLNFRIKLHTMYWIKLHTMYYLIDIQRGTCNYMHALGGGGGGTCSKDTGGTVSCAICT